MDILLLIALLILVITGTSIIGACIAYVVAQNHVYE